jgi:hypothetical protein
MQSQGVLEEGPKAQSAGLTVKEVRTTYSFKDSSLFHASYRKKTCFEEEVS